MTVFQIDDPVAQFPPGLRIGNLGALVGHVGIDIPVQYHAFPLRQPAPDRRSRIGPVAGVQQRHDIGIDPVDSAELAPQKAGDQLSVHGRVETREVKVFVPDAPRGEHLLQTVNLGGLSGPVEAFQNKQGHFFRISNRVIRAGCRPSPVVFSFLPSFSASCAGPPQALVAKRDGHIHSSTTNGSPNDSRYPERALPRWPERNGRRAPPQERSMRAARFRPSASISISPKVLYMASDARTIDVMP